MVTPNVFLLISFKKNNTFVSEQQLAKPKKLTFYYCFHKYLLGEAGLSDILNLNIQIGSPACNTGTEPASILYETTTKGLLFALH